MCVGALDSFAAPCRLSPLKVLKITDFANTQFNTLDDDVEASVEFTIGID